MKVFIDTNLVLDVLAQRRPFYEASARIWELVESRDLKGYLSATTITDIFYILKRQLGAKKAYDFVNKIMLVFDITSVSQADIRKALNLAFKDFEDGLQVVCGKKIGAKYFVTRNTEDFQEAEGIEVVDPETFLLSRAH